MSMFRHLVVPMVVENQIVLCVLYNLYRDMDDMDVHVSFIPTQSCVAFVFRSHTKHENKIVLANGRNQ